ncbi:S41 family peptidase [Cytophagaceae bacterium DM2B3-1]|uniref:S41 family peptidase n=1 Tax=Xanthocytophaga flava TaxID=3048013 RepID=A0ABT7CED8_9BACT|nr:S41 family peptidase [Xanthocytophaga flavus]MDJ1469999.1 S41 family peptidase [Xanthocytophaga flavus]MDJ1491437.1 S41 family peptidase [Xanthocytophaga flavus]
MTRQSLLLVVTFLGMMVGFAQTEANRVENYSASAYQKSLVRYKKDDCIEDLRKLEAVMKEAHPCLYCFTDSLTFHQTFANKIAFLDQKKDSTISENEFLTIVRELVALVQDGHLYAESNESLVNYVSERGKFFPLSLAIEDNKAYIRQNYSTMLDSTALGSQLLTVNGVAIEEIIAKMMPLLSADANLEKARWRQLENVFTFDILYWSLYEPTDMYEVSYRMQDGSVRKSKIDAVTGSTINTANAVDEVTRRFNIDEATSTAYLDINTFYNSENKHDNATYEKFLADSFKQLNAKNIQNLIIDLRDNPGGLVHNAYRLFSYISPVNVESKVMVKSSTFLKEQKKLSFIEILMKKLSRNSYAARIDRAAPGTLVEITSKQHFITNVEKKYSGKVYILANGATFSAASMLVKLCKDQHVGIIVGEENAACQAVSFGDLIKYDLPNTLTKVYVSTSIVNREDDLEKSSIRPQIALGRDVYDDARGGDSVLKQLMELIHQSASPSPIARSQK